MDRSTFEFGSANSIDFEQWQRQSKTSFVLRIFRKHIALIMTVLVVFALLLVINIFLIFHAPQGSSESSEPEVEFAHTDPVKDLMIFNRSSWSAMDTQLPELGKPDTIVIAHTNTETCLSNTTCTQLLQHLQAVYVLARKKPDIAFNFLIGGNGVIYEGTGWHRQAGVSRGYTNSTLYVAFMGAFDKIMPSIRQLSAAKLFIRNAVENELIASEYVLHGENQVSGSSSSPGVALFSVIRTWERFKEI